ncbi:hypothetical protein [Nocardia altamirensis]|uniref:hypothetical protein n=1 Tax=Nocardia altamirensis TaxID=472158 RepID=UPI0008400B2A|nr:hypothetical protein [Nocardia altamirensis]
MATLSLHEDNLSRCLHSDDSIRETPLTLHGWRTHWSTATRTILDCLAYHGEIFSAVGLRGDPPIEIAYDIVDEPYDYPDSVLAYAYTPNEGIRLATIAYFEHNNLVTHPADPDHCEDRRLFDTPFQAAEAFARRLLDDLNTQFHAQQDALADYTRLTA